jgi:hypothetical protein
MTVPVPVIAAAVRELAIGKNAGRASRDGQPNKITDGS